MEAIVLINFEDSPSLGDVMRAMNRSIKRTKELKTLKREASKNLRRIMAPLVQEQRARLMALPSKRSGYPGLRMSVAKQVKAATRWSGDRAGVQIIQRARGMPREFNMAGRMLNRAEGWNPTSLAGETFHEQISPANWFDGPVLDSRPEIRRQVIAALEETAAKMARSAHE